MDHNACISRLLGDAIVLSIVAVPEGFVEVDCFKVEAKLKVSDKDVVVELE
eukprot:m.47126 g.47126  ORF g.47126 m.47126 type:complete len:51 (+) comp7311_c1_seq1:126-278(+)